MEVIIISYIAFFLPNVLCVPISQDPEEKIYCEERNNLIATSKHQAVGYSLELNSAEQEANKILMQHKNSDIEKGVKDPKSFLAAKHFFISQPLIEKTCIFKIIQKLPKGASLHTHTTSLVSGEFLLNNLTYRENLYALENENGKIQLNFFKKAPTEKWKNVQELRKTDPKFNERLKKQISLVRENPYEQYFTQDDIWTAFENVFKTTSSIIKYKPAFEDYFYQSLKELYEDNVKYLEFRGGTTKLYDLDGNKFDSEETIKVILEVTKKFKRDHPDFVGVKLIYAIKRSANIKQLEQNIKIFRSLKEKYPYFVAGFDLVGQEDVGHPLVDYITQLLDLKDTKFFFHAGETLWNGDLIDQNLFDAVLLNTSRIGHGYAILKHPAIYKLVKERKIPVEISPISNQVLGLVHDLRNHPATNFIANNFPVIITSDDPTCWGSKALSHDWYLAFMALSGKDSDLRFLKQLAINSIIFSGMSLIGKFIFLQQWQADWDLFVNDMVNLEDCT